jgi:hypothetical protein
MFLLAAEKGNLEVVKFLMTAGANKDVQNKVSVMQRCFNGTECFFARVLC